MPTATWAKYAGKVGVSDLTDLVDLIGEASAGEGSQGPPGPEGPTGPQGPQGPAGATGAQGPAGNDGATGATGPQGPQGATGADGPQGPAGAQGPAGPQGPQGEQGASGTDGAQGAQGPQGPQGNQGAQGPTGPQGAQGPTGDDGADGAGVPAGGTIGQVLTKAGTADFDTSWQTPAAGGEAFPVGSVFIAVVSTNPATLLGYGTWSAFAAGRMLVGLDAGQSEFDTVEETGGAKTVTLTGAQSGIAQHTHLQNAHGHTISGGSSDDTSAPFTGPDASTSTATAFGGGIGSTTATNQDAGPTDAAQAHPNLPPYITCYMWKRTA